MEGLKTPLPATRPKWPVTRQRCWPWIHELEIGSAWPVTNNSTLANPVSAGQSCLRAEGPCSCTTDVLLTQIRFASSKALAVFQLAEVAPPLAFPWHPDFVAFPSAHETCNRRVYPRFGRDLVALAKKGVRVAKGWLGPVLEIGKGICKLIACKLQSFGHSLCALARMRFGCSWLFLYLAWCESEKWVKGLSVRYFCHNFFSHCPRHSPLSSMLPGSEPNVVLFLAACLAGKV